MSDTAVTRLAARQGGVVRSGQVDQLGFTPRMRDYRLSAGRWTAIGRLGYRVLPMPGAADRLRAAVALLPGAIVSHAAAAYLRALPGFTRLEPVVTVHSRTTHAFPLVTVRRSHDLLDSHWSRVDGLPVTTAERSVIDLAAELPARRIADLIQDLIIRRSISLSELKRIAGEVCRRGKPGSSTIREVLDRLTEEPVAQSVLERRGRELLAFGMLPEPAHEYPVPWSPQRRFDDAYPDARLAIEWDSRSWHGRLERLESDRRRDRACVIHGWRILRFTWNDVSTRQNDVVATVAAALGYADSA